MKKRSGYYELADNLFRFMYRFVYQFKSLIEQGRSDYVIDNYFYPYFNEYLGKTFETVAKQYLLKLNSQNKLPFTVENFGTWWGTDRNTRKSVEIDIIGLARDNGLFAECKYQNKPMGVDIFKKLENHSYLFDVNNKYYYLFSRSGFTSNLRNISGERQDLFLIDLEKIKFA